MNRTEEPEEIDVLALACAKIEERKAWDEQSVEFEALLGRVEPYAKHINGLLCGTHTLDARTKEGQRLIGMVLDVTFRALVFHRKHATEADIEAQRVSENGGSEAPADAE